jgi:hypothetical protein
MSALPQKQLVAADCRALDTQISLAYGTTGKSRSIFAVSNWRAELPSGEGFRRSHTCFLTPTELRQALEARAVGSEISRYHQFAQILRVLICSPFVPTQAFETSDMPAQ